MLVCVHAGDILLGSTKTAPIRSLKVFTLDTRKASEPVSTSTTLP